MTENTFVSASVDEEIRNEAEVVLAEVGLTIPDAIRLLLIRIAKEKTLVFNPFIPNAETIAAMNDARNGNVKRFDSVETLFEDLNALDRE